MNNQTFQSGKEYEPNINHSMPEQNYNNKQGIGFFNEQKMGEKNGLTANITTKDWLKFQALSLLSFVPFVGSIMLLILFIILICNKETNITLRNYLKASLIWSLIFSGIFVVLFMLVIVPFISGSLAGASLNNSSTIYDTVSTINYY